jgi:CRP-like cAMP-binding protein
VKGTSSTLPIAVGPTRQRHSVMAELPRAAHHRTNRILAALEREDFAYLEPHLEIVDLQRGQVLYETGEPLRYVYFPHDTIVSLVTLMEDGGSAEMAVFGREGLLGLVSALVTRQSFGRYIVQVTGMASRIDIDRMHKAIASHPRIRRLFLHYTEALMAQVLQTVACNAVHGAEARCCRWILSMHDRLDQNALPLTHEFLAECLGVQRSTVTIITRTLQAAGLIRQGRGVIVVTDRPGLEEAACECYGKIRRSFERLLPKTYTRVTVPEGPVAKFENGGGMGRAGPHVTTAIRGKASLKATLIRPFLSSLTNFATGPYHPWTNGQAERMNPSRRPPSRSSITRPSRASPRTSLPS